MLKLVIIIFTTIVAITISSISFKDRGDGNYKPFTIPPSVTVVSRQRELDPRICSIDLNSGYTYDGPTYHGIPFIGFETVDDECGANLSDPKYFIKVYPVGFILNAFIYVGFGVGLYKLVIIRKGRSN